MASALNPSEPTIPPQGADGEVVWVKSLDMVLKCVSLPPQHWVPLGDLITRQMHTARASVEGPHVRSGF